MIRFTTGNLLDAKADALVNTVNTVGVMGKGIALQFKETFPENFAAYRVACERHEVQVGHMFVFERRSLVGPRWIINFPTKKHWIHPSRLDWIREGLADLVRVVRELGIRTIAIPPLGAGHGGLDWSGVRPLIETAAASLPDVDVLVFEPIGPYHPKPKAMGVEALTPARALVVDLVRRYAVLGFDCSVLEIQKLAYFLQLALRGLGIANPLKLTFKANKYGPYAHALQHVLDALDGSYLRSAKRLADSKPYDPISVELDRLPAVEAYLAAEASIYTPALDAVDRLIDGFQSPYHMELLATVDWLARQQHVALTASEMRRGLAAWPAGDDAARRKGELFAEDALELAVSRLRSESGWLGYESTDRRSASR